ncbi:hypothetical protein KSP39_PZI002966 [Platanthera zijinensis]|uniref:Uncharacterized protein n=1 Tax=Platanthera zijinensis TaxID=2320716 RepID=A0AAP0BZX6_9ASPA
MGSAPGAGRWPDSPPLAGGRRTDSTPRAQLARGLGLGLTDLASCRLHSPDTELRPIRYDDLKWLGIPPPPEGRFLSHSQGGESGERETLQPSRNRVALLHLSGLRMYLSGLAPSLLPRFFPPFLSAFISFPCLTLGPTYPPTLCDFSSLSSCVRYLCSLLLTFFSLFFLSPAGSLRLAIPAMVDVSQALLSAVAPLPEHLARAVFFAAKSAQQSMILYPSRSCRLPDRLTTSAHLLLLPLLALVAVLLPCKAHATRIPTRRSHFCSHNRAYCSPSRICYSPGRRLLSSPQLLLYLPLELITLPLELIAWPPVISAIANHSHVWCSPSR